MFFGEFAADGEAEAGSLALGLGGIEGVEYPRTVFRGDARSGVGDFTENALVVSIGADLHAALIVGQRNDGVAGVHHEIDQDLLHLANVAHDGEAGTDLGVDLDALAQKMGADEFEHVAHDRGHFVAGLFTFVHARVVEQLVDDALHLFGRADRDVQFFVNFGLGARFHLGVFQRERNGAERSVELVGDAGRELAHGGEFAGLDQLSLRTGDLLVEAAVGERDTGFHGQRIQKVEMTWAVAVAFGCQGAPLRDGSDEHGSHGSWLRQVDPLWDEGRVSRRNPAVEHDGPARGLDHGPDVGGQPLQQLGALQRGSQITKRFKQVRKVVGPRGLVGELQLESQLVSLLAGHHSGLGGELQSGQDREQQQKGRQVAAGEQHPRADEADNLGQQLVVQLSAHEARANHQVDQTGTERGRGPRVREQARSDNDGREVSKQIGERARTRQSPQSGGTQNEKAEREARAQHRGEAERKAGGEAAGGSDAHCAQLGKQRRHGEEPARGFEHGPGGAPKSKRHQHTRRDQESCHGARFGGVTGGAFRQREPCDFMVRILVLEDDLELQTILSQLLLEQGYDVHVASRGEEALALALKHEFDLVVADVRLEGMDGLDTVAQMRDQQPSLHSLIVSGYASEEQTLRALQLGVGGYLKKPFKLQDFLANVQRLAREKQDQQKGRQFRTLLRWVCEALARTGELQRVLRAEAAVVRLARLCGEVDGEELHLAGLLAALERAGSGPTPNEVLPSKRVRRALRHSDEHWDGSGRTGLRGEQIPREARLVTAALHGAGFAVQPEWVEPELLQLWQQEDPEVEVAPPVGTLGLLTLARTLESAGDSSHAAAAYEEILKRSPQSREGTAALAGRARLASASGDAAQAREFALRTAATARQQGPQQHAGSLLEAGLVLHSLGAEAEGEGMLKEAEAVFRQLELPGLWAAARLAQPSIWDLGPERDHCLGLLGSFEHASELSQCAAWLLPKLLNAAASPMTERILKRLLLECPEETRRLLNGSHDVATRRRLAGYLAGSEGPAVLALAQDEDPGVRQLLQQGNGAATGVQMLRIYALGAFEVMVGPRKIDPAAFKTQKARYLLAYVAAGESQVPEERVLDLFWEGDPTRARQSLSNALYAIRKALGEDYITRAQGCLMMNPGVMWHDLKELEKAYGEDALARVVRLYRGPYLDACYMDWASERRRSVQQMAVNALSRLLEESHEAGRVQQVQDYAQTLLTIDGCRQDAHLRLMQSYLAQGQPEQAIRQYEVCQKTLARELDMEPSLAIFEAYQRARLLG